MPKKEGKKPIITPVYDTKMEKTSAPPPVKVKGIISPRDGVNK